MVLNCAVVELRGIEDESQLRAHHHHGEKKPGWTPPRRALAQCLQEGSAGLCSRSCAKVHEPLLIDLTKVRPEVIPDRLVTAEKGFHFPTGRPACEYVGYPDEELDTIPPSALASFAGVGYPFAASVIKPGMTVPDIGSGSGRHLINAAHLIGPDGKVLGIDLTNEMIRKGIRSLQLAGIRKAEISKGNAESHPFDDQSVDVVTSNGVLNLLPDKKTAFREIFRVLKPGGHIQISDIVLATEISDQSKANPQLWAECIVGAIPEQAHVDLIGETGFADVEIVGRIDYFDRSPSHSTKKAANQFGATSITIRGREPAA